MLLIASVKHGVSQCSLLCIINSVILQSAVSLSHRNQTEQFVLINDSKIFYKAPFGLFMNNYTSITSSYKMNPPIPNPPFKSQDKTRAFYSSEKMVFSRTLHKPTTTNKMGEAEKQLYHRLQSNMPESLPFSLHPLPTQTPKSGKTDSSLQTTASPTTQCILKNTRQVLRLFYLLEKKKNQIGTLIQTTLRFKCFS